MNIPQNIKKIRTTIYKYNLNIRGVGTSGGIQLFKKAPHPNLKKMVFIRKEMTKQVPVSGSISDHFQKVKEQRRQWQNPSFISMLSPPHGGAHLLITQLNLFMFGFLFAHVQI